MLVVVATTTAVALVRGALTPWLGTDAPLLAFLLAVFASASVAGVFAGVGATLLGALVGTFFFIAPTGEMDVVDAVERVRVALFVGVGSLISVSSEALLRARRRLEQAMAAKEQALREREALLEKERAARAEAEALARLRDEFVSTVSHELRTPVSAILGFSALLQQHGALDEKGVHMLEIIERNARAQAKLVEEMLDLGRILGGQLQLAHETVDLRAPVLEALSSVRTSADAKRITISVEPGSEPVWVRGDAARLRQIAWALLSNALKFTPRGGEVRVAIERDAERARLVVSDTGQGIEPEFLPHVFERFRQQDSSSTRVHGGLGVGLSVARHLAELHGGTVSATSDGVGRGARFEVAIPLAARLSTDSSGSRSWEPGTCAARR